LEEGSESRFWPFFSKLFSGKSEPSIEKMIMEASEDGELKPDEVSMLLNVLRLGRMRVEDIIIPRPDIVCAEIDDGVEAIVSSIMESGHSRIPIYKDTRDNIVGIVHAKDLLKALIKPGSGETCASELRVKDIMRQPFFIPETKNVKDLLQEFRSRKVHLAIAVDEYGGTSGLVTFEDVLEEIVGEIEDEYDAPRPEEIRVLEDNTLLVAGRTLLEELTEHIDLDLDSELVETVGGYLCELAGRVPVAGESFTVSGHRFLVKEADAKQIRSILVQPPKVED
jgi:magnesium and cobalt transporter